MSKNTESNNEKNSKRLITGFWLFQFQMKNCIQLFKFVGMTKRWKLKISKNSQIATIKFARSRLQS